MVSMLTTNTLSKHASNNKHTGKCVEPRYLLCKSLHHCQHVGCATDEICELPLFYSSISYTACPNVHKYTRYIYSLLPDKPVSSHTGSQLFDQQITNRKFPSDKLWIIVWVLSNNSEVPSAGLTAFLVSSKVTAKKLLAIPIYTLCLVDFWK